MKADCGAEVARNKPKTPFFKPLDLAVYALVAVIIAVAVIVPFTAKRPLLDSLEVFYSERLIYTYDFSKNSGKISSDCPIDITESHGDTLLVEFKNGSDVNVLEIFDGRAQMREANCSVYAECVNCFSAITRGGDVIVCLPHKLKVVGVGANDNTVIL